MARRSSPPSEGSHTANDYYNRATPITPSDSVNITAFGQFSSLTDAVYVGGAGVVAAVQEDNSVVNYTAVAGEILPIRVKRINSTNTTATLMNALYSV